jgi:hypothetical protein
MIKKWETLPHNISYKCGDNKAPVATFVANANLKLDTAALK